MVDGAVRRRDEPGARDWDVVVGARFIAAIAAPANDRVLSALVEQAVTPEADLEDLVARIPMGYGGVEHLAIVWWPTEGDPITAIVRGDAVVDLVSPGGTRRLDSRGIVPWHLAEFTAVTRLRITGANASPDGVRQVGLRGAPVAADRAAFRASAVEWSWREAPAAPGTAASESADAGAARPAPPAGPSRASADRRHPLTKVPTMPLDLVGDGADTVRHVRGDVAEADTVLTPAARRRAGGPREGDVRADAAASARARTGRDRGASAPSAPGYRIVGGATGTVAGSVIIGRSPSAPRVAGESVELVRVDSPSGVVSAAHLELRIEGERLVAVDLRSTNGTVVRSRSGRRRLRSGESVVVSAGTSLVLGGDTIVEILPAPGSVDA
ncbi:FHA domain-containing protein [Agromyces marinus]|uniref:FHA domain-containing protein n=1 Tax=Agromyces marinus TaxID=1389020 RepID=A0ABN6Y8S3_9MICO|nr:FHA domain-containing protein [Agromyces marinus]UIP58164.1 hypothetical protein DSM26151_10350 [Agromyces marinus]BDZ53606.1 hypothetical protein GCM10025870_06790 [Agromyces marinus]